MMWLLALAPVLAATPGGFRVDTALPVMSFSARQVFIMNPGDPWTSQTAVRAGGVLGHWGFDVQLPFVYSWEPSWSDAGLGQLRIGGRRFVHDAPSVLIGVELAFPVVPRRFGVSAWGSNARETLPGTEFLALVETTLLSQAPVTLRAAIGWYEGPFLGSPDSKGPSFLVELAAVKVFPLWGPLSFVTELELLRDPTPVTGRALARFDPSDHLSMDFGAQIPVMEYLENPRSLQLIAQARSFF